MSKELTTEQRIVQLLRSIEKVKFTRTDAPNDNYEKEEIRHKINFFGVLLAQEKKYKKVTFYTVEKDMTIPVNVIKNYQFDNDGDSFAWFELRDLIKVADKDFVKKATAIKQSEEFNKFLATILPE